MIPYVYEFLYRGADPGDPDAAPAWHVIMRALPGENWPGERMFNMDQAVAAGFELPDLIAGINAAALAQADRLTARLQAAEGGDA